MVQLSRPATSKLHTPPYDKSTLDRFALQVSFIFFGVLQFVRCKTVGFAFLWSKE